MTRRRKAIDAPARRRTLVLAALVAAVFWLAGSWRAGAGAPVGGADPATSVGAAAAAPTTAPAGVPASAGPADGSPRGDSDSHAPSDAHGGAVPKVLLSLMMMLVLAKLGGELFERVGQPAVLGELIFGIGLGNLGLFGAVSLGEVVRGVTHDPQASAFLVILSELGVILLLFEVGLESTVREMARVGPASLAVAVVGMVLPLGLGWGVGAWFLPNEPFTVHLFLGACLSATSVGITARVLKDLKMTHLPEAKIVLGAAVIDDILGLVVLAVAQGVAEGAATGRVMGLGALLLIAAKAIGFFIGAIAIGLAVSGRMYRVATFLNVQGVLISLTLGWCFLVAWVGTLMGVAPIVGAFAAGLVLESATFKDWHGRDAEVEDLLRPLTAFLVPVFFVHTGMGVDLSAFSRPGILGFAAALTVAAVFGKQMSGLAARGPGLNRAAIGAGMVPRGEVGLIIANVGRTMKTPEGHPLISDDTFSAAVIMVVATTMLTPPVLKGLLTGRGREPDDDAKAEVTG